MPRRIGVWSSCLIFSVLSATLWGGVASANNYGGTISVDGSYWYYNEGPAQRYWYNTNVTSYWTSASDWTRVNNINPTDMSTSLVSLHDNSDVAVYVEYYGDTSWIGRSECISSSSGHICHHWHEKFNASWGPFTTSQREHLTCHEFGHTTGLQHYSSSSTPYSCMKEAGQLYFSNHDIGHINGYF